MLALLALASLTACSDKDDPSADTGTSETSTAQPYAWPEPADSLCDNPASIVQLTAVLPGGADSLEGDVVVALMHRRYGQPSNGGHPHWLWTFEDQTVSADSPFFAEIDMCEGNAIMWSEENCEYNLIVLLDQDGDNGLSGFRQAKPDEGEPAAVQAFEMSCHSDGPYQFELTLDCTDGKDCVDYEAEATCECAEESCPSESGICWL